MFDKSMMNQLLKPKKTVRQDIIDNLAASSKPLTNLELEAQAQTWATSRDISIELVAMKSMELVEITGYAPKTYPPRGLWGLTDKGRQMATIQEKAAA